MYKEAKATTFFDKPIGNAAPTNRAPGIAHLPRALVISAVGANAGGTWAAASTDWGDPTVHVFLLKHGKDFSSQSSFDGGVSGLGRRFGT